MANAIIVAVRKDDNGVITHVRTRTKTNIGYSPPEVLSKVQAIQNITIFHVRYTVLDENGPEVRVVANKYLRSVPNDTEEDNLGELPTF